MELKSSPGLLATATGSAGVASSHGPDGGAERAGSRRGAESAGNGGAEHRDGCAFVSLRECD